MFEKQPIICCICGKYFMTDFTYCGGYVCSTDCKREYELRKSCYITGTKYEKRIKWEEIPNYGDHMTLQEWREDVKSNFFNDMDGTAYYATIDKLSDEVAYCNISDIDNAIEQGKFTHVVFFGK